MKSRMREICTCGSVRGNETYLSLIIREEEVESCLLDGWIYMLKVPYGISGYKLLKTEGYYYVDKTMYLEKLEKAGRPLVYLRPGRFGKSLFTSMMYYYYEY